MRFRNTSVCFYVFNSTLLAVTLFALVFVSGHAGAQAAPTPAEKAAAGGGPPKEDKKLDISDLENKYWAPKDTDFSVVQNRTYPKEKKFFISPQYGIVVNDQS